MRNCRIRVEFYEDKGPGIEYAAERNISFSSPTQFLYRALTVLKYIYVSWVQGSMDVDALFPASGLTDRQKYYWNRKDGPGPSAEGRLKFP